MKNFDLKKEIEEKKISAYKLSEDTKIPYTTISELVTKKRDFKNVKLYNALKILFYLYNDEKEIIKILKNIQKTT